MQHYTASRNPSKRTYISSQLARSPPPPPLTPWSTHQCVLTTMEAAATSTTPTDGCIVSFVETCTCGFHACARCSRTASTRAGVRFYLLAQMMHAQIRAVHERRLCPEVDKKRPPPSVLWCRLPVGGHVDTRGNSILSVFGVCVCAPSARRAARSWHCAAAAPVSTTTACRPRAARLRQPVT